MIYFLLRVGVFDKVNCFNPLIVLVCKAKSLHNKSSLRGYSQSVSSCLHKLDCYIILGWKALSGRTVRLIGPISKLRRKWRAVKTTPDPWVCDRVYLTHSILHSVSGCNGATTLSITTSSTMAISVKAWYVTRKISETQDKWQGITMLCNYAECHYVKCRFLLIIMLNVILLSVTAPL